MHLQKSLITVGALAGLVVAIPIEKRAACSSYSEAAASVLLCLGMLTGNSSPQYSRDIGGTG